MKQETKIKIVEKVREDERVKESLKYNSLEKLSTSGIYRSGIQELIGDIAFDILFESGYAEENRMYIEDEAEMIEMFFKTA